MKKWQVLGKLQGSKISTDRVIEILLRNRDIKTKKEREDFLNPKLSQITVKKVEIDKRKLQKTVERIKKAIKTKEQIIIFGDYDVDGITGSAILWETLNLLGAKVLPYIPNRIDEGYGLSVRGIENLKVKIPDVRLIITVDNGIVANEAVEFAKKQGIDVVITDHHLPAKKLPEAFSIVHTTKLCGAGVAWILSREFKAKATRSASSGQDHLDLAALGTIADLVPLRGANRVLVRHGLEALRNTKRIGLLELFRAAGLEQGSIGAYEVGHAIAPRINAMGRLESAMDSLRLLCTTNRQRAQELAIKLSDTNTKRQSVTQEAVLHALASIKVGKVDGKLIFVAHESYQQGVIGLVAGKLVEEYYLPSIVVSKGQIYSKASARSISGFNIIEFIRCASELLVDAGGHPMAAGFTVETAKIELVQNKLQELAKKQVTKELLNKVLRIDCELPIQSIDSRLYEAIFALSPFGMGNPVPVFASKNVQIEELRTVGNGSKHLKLKFKVDGSGFMEGIWFNAGEYASKLKIGDKVDLAYTVDQNVWNGNTRLQLKIKDIKP